MPETPLIIQIQKDCLDRKIRISDTLRKAKVAAVKLDLTEFLAWIDSELNGYTSETAAAELPPYRILKGELKALNPYHGWRPVVFQNKDTADSMASAPIGQPIGSLEAMVDEGDANGTYSFSLPPSVKSSLIRKLDLSDVILEVGRGNLVNIVEAVRNILLEWTLKMEKASILGEGMSFKNEDKIEATHMTQNFYSKSIGFAGSTHDHSRVIAMQNIYKTDIDLAAVRSLIRQAQQELGKLPDQISDEVGDYLVKIKQEAAKPQPDHSRVRSLLSSLKAVCEAAAGNLAAQGITGLISSILG